MAILGELLCFSPLPSSNNHFVPTQKQILMKQNMLSEAVIALLIAAVNNAEHYQQKKMEQEIEVGEYEVNLFDTKYCNKFLLYCREVVWIFKV